MHTGCWIKTVYLFKLAMQVEFCVCYQTVFFPQNLDSKKTIATEPKHSPFHPPIRKRSSIQYHHGKLNVNTLARRSPCIFAYMWCHPILLYLWRKWTPWTLETKRKYTRCISCISIQMYLTHFSNKLFYCLISTLKSRSLAFTKKCTKKNTQKLYFIQFLTF